MKIVIVSVHRKWDRLVIYWHALVPKSAKQNTRSDSHTLSKYHGNFKLQKKSKNAKQKTKKQNKKKKN